MEPLSSFGISFAAGVALDILNKTQVKVKNEIKKAFEEALSLWCVNADIRESKRNEIKSTLDKFIDKPELFTDINNQSPEIYSFFKKFDETLAHHSAAYKYIKEIKDIERYRKEISILSRIKDTVEDTNKKFTDFIEKNLPESSKLLEGEWKRQLNVYKESIANFKPRSALNMLLSLEESFESNELKPSINLLSFIEYLKAQCYELTGNSKEMYRSYIKANQLDSSTIQIKEKACYSYAKIGEKEKSNKLISELLKYDEFNVVAWAVKIIIDGGKNLETLILETPTIVRSDWNFKRLVYLNILDIEYYEQQMEIFKRYEFLTENFVEEPITLTNYKKAIFVIEINLTQLLRAPINSFTRIQFDDLEFIKNINKTLEHFLNEMSDSEIFIQFKKFEFFYQFTEFVLTENIGSVQRMKSIYVEINKQDIALLIILANALQLIDEVDEAIKIIKKEETRSIETLQLEAFCYLKNSDIENYIRVSKELTSSINKIDFFSSESILSFLVTLYQHNRISEINPNDFLINKEFQSEELKKLFTSFFQILKKQNIENNILILQTIENEIFKIDSSIKFYIPYSYYILEKWELAKLSFRKYVSTVKESRDLFYYILAIERSHSDHEELLDLLLFWRINLSFNDELLRIEADICRKLSDWDRCQTIANEYLSKYPTDESFLVLQLLTLNELNTKDKQEKIEQLAEVFRDFEFKFYGHIPIVAKILIENEIHQIALDILFQKASDTGDIQARMDYFQATIQLPKGYFHENEIVEYGWHVKYLLESKIKFIKVQKGNPLAEKLLGHKVGDTVEIERPIVRTIDSIQIMRIMDKYLSLHDEILEDVKSNPHAGFPMQSFEFNDTSPDGIKKTLKELFGAEGTIQKYREVDAFKKYYTFKLSLTEIILQIYNSDYLGGYFNLIAFKEGITQIPMVYYPEKILTDNSEIIIDLSSLLILHQISYEHQIAFKSKFLIAKGVVEYIRALHKKEILEPKANMVLDITHERIAASYIPKEASSGNLKYFERLLKWIKSNCIETIVISKLDLISKLEVKAENDTLMNLVIENISFAMEKDTRIIMTDDLIYYNLFHPQSMKIISSELFVKSSINGKEDCLIEFVKNKYIGHSFHLDILIQEFNKKEKGQPNNFAHCINNTALWLIPSKNTILTIIRFLKHLATNSHITNEYFMIESTNIFVSLLKGITDIESFIETKSLINDEFKLMGIKLDMVLECYRRALLILKVS